MELVLQLSFFLFSSVLFLSKSTYKDKEDPIYIILKCAPTIALIYFILKRNGFGLEDKYIYTRRILYALILSVIADALVCFNILLLIALVIFSTVHLVYISALGFIPFEHAIGCVVFAIELVAYHFVSPYIQYKLFIFGFPFYFTLVFTMIWRSTALVLDSKGLIWQRTAALIGSLLFLVRDIVIFYNQFILMSIENNFLLMLVYYLAQLGLTCSAVDTHKMPSKPMKMQ